LFNTWYNDSSAACPLAQPGPLVAVVATDEPDEEHERPRANLDDAFLWGEHLPSSRLRLLDAVARARAGAGAGRAHLAPGLSGDAWGRIAAARSST
jgi:hypothetical protein